MNTTKQNHHSYYQLLRPLASPRPQQISGKDALFPGPRAAVAEVPLRGAGDARLPELLHPGPERKIEHPRGLVVAPRAAGTFPAATRVARTEQQGDPPLIER